MDRRSILLAEEDEASADLIGIAFKEAGAENPVDVVANEEATTAYLDRKIREGSVSLPVLIILGLRIADDFAVLGWIKTQPELVGIPVFVFSGEVADYDGRAREVGASYYAAKPMGYGELAVLVRDVTNRWLTKQS
ncbi:MAG TPA: hypothetical protein VKY92_02715 [Verrucomicrobiae bacterium]|nr:hypothetical protein [Verrucomicrobiae bacterium]